MKPTKKQIKFLEDEAGSSDEEDRLEKPNEEFDKLMLKPRAKLIDFDMLEAMDGLEITSEESEDENIPKNQVFRFGCERNCEEEAVFAVTFKYHLELQVSEQAPILGVYCWKTKFPGAVFVETDFDRTAKQAVRDVRVIKNYDMLKMNNDFIVKMFQPPTGCQVSTKLGQWVKIRQHYLYNNDLGKVMEINESKGRGLVKVIPREKREIQYKTQRQATQFVRGPKIPIHTQEAATTSSQFQYDSLVKEKQEAKSAGFTLVWVPLNSLQTSNFMVGPKEILEFFPDVATITKLPHSIRAEFKWHNMQQQRKNVERPTTKIIEVPQLKKYDYVYVVDGEYIGQHGIILQLEGHYAQVSTADNQVLEVHLLDLNKKNINVGIIDLKQHLRFKRFDVVLFGSLEMDVGCILAINNNLATVLDINNRTRDVNMHAMKLLIDSQLRTNNVVTIREGFYKGSQANVIQTYKDRTYLFSAKFAQNVIIEHTDNLENLATLQYHRGRNLRDLLGSIVTISSGPWNEYRGTVMAVYPKIKVQLCAKDITIVVTEQQITTY